MKIGNLLAQAKADDTVGIHYREAFNREGFVQI